MGTKIIFPVVLLIYPILAQCCVSYRNQSLIYKANQMTGFSMKYNTGLKWAEQK